MFLLVLIINILKLKNLVQILDKFYKAKISKFIKIINKVLPSLNNYL